jgi:phage baseplate assembly protein W
MSTETPVDFPYAIDGRGRTATTDQDDHVRDLIEQVLFTSPGERVMRPDFGSGLLRLVFEPASVEVAATAQYLVQSGLEQYLSDVLTVEQVSVEIEDAAVVVTVTYLVLSSQQRQVATFHAPGGGA